MRSVDRVFERNGSYHYDLGRDEHGKRRSKKLCRVDAGEHALLEALAKVTKPAATTVKDMYETFLRRGMAELAPRTRLDYCSYRDALYRVFGDCEPSDVEPHEIAQYLEKRSAKKLANKEIAALSSAYNYAMRNGLAKFNPCRGVRRNKVKPRDRYIRDDEFRTVLDAMPEHLQDIMAGIYLMELRPGEARRLLRECVTAEGVLIQETKTGKRKLVKWSPGLQYVLERAMGRCESRYVFTNSRGEAWTEPAMHSALRRIWKLLPDALRWRWHDLRAKGESDHRAGGHGLLDLYRRAKVVEPVDLEAVRQARERARKR